MRLLSVEKLFIASHCLIPSGLGDTIASFHDLHCPSPA
jgi:hypothetical protein